MATPNYDLAAAETIEAPRGGVSRRPADPSDRSATPAKPKVRLVAGSTPHMSGETHLLLRRRLQLVSLLLCTGFTAFIVWCVINAFTDNNWERFGKLFVVHG